MELSAAIKAYTENAFPDTFGVSSEDQIATCIREAEQRIYNSVQLLVSRKTVTDTLTGGDPYYTLPTDWLASFSIAVVDPATGDYQFLRNKDIEFIRSAYPNPTDTAIPEFYAYFDSTQYILGPTPADDYDVQVQYYAYPNSIVDDGTSWLGDNFDSVLLYGALLEAYTFMKGETDVLTEYQKRYDEALALLRQLAEGKNRQDSYRTEQVRYPVR